MSPPRVAVIAPYLPAPEDSGGRIRIAALSRALSARCEVELFARAWPVELEGPSAARADALAHFVALHLFARDLPAGIPGWHPWRARDATPIALLGALRARHRDRPFAAVVACHAYASLAFAAAPGAVRVLDEHNVESRYARDVLGAPAREWRAMARLERAAWSTASLVSCVRQEDADEIGRRARGRVALIANGTRAMPWRAPGARSGRGILFVGAMSHGPNVAAAKRLAMEVLPRVLGREPDAKLVLCGRAPTREVLALAGPRVAVTGTVVDTSPFVDAASIFVNPLTHGEGTSLKMLEAAAAGLPIVSTAVGARGLAMRDGEHLLLAERDDAIADAILECWRDPDGAARRADAARALASRHAWSDLAARFAEHVVKSLRAHGGGS